LGWILATIAFLKPASSNAMFQFSIPATTAGIISSGVVFSTQYTTGSTGSDRSASGSFFINLHLFINAKLGKFSYEVKSVTY